MIELFIAGALLAQASGATASDRMDIGPRPRGDLVALLRDRLGDDLRDAASAEIRITRGLRRASLPITDTASFEGYAVCATVNAKNAYGAYVGRKPYVFMWWGESGRLAAWPVEDARVPDPSDLRAECDKPAD